MYMYFFCWLPRLLLLLLLPPPRYQTERRECPSFGMGILYCHHREHDWKLHQYFRCRYMYICSFWRPQAETVGDDGDRATQSPCALFSFWPRLNGSTPPKRL